MKKNNLYQKLNKFPVKALMVSLVFIASSCGESFLEQQPRDMLTDEYVKEALTKAGQENVLNTLFWSLNPRWSVQDANNWLNIEGLSDNSSAGGDDESSYRKTQFYEITPENTFGGRWGYYYKVAVEANIAIKNIYNLFDKEGKSKEMAEAKFYRGWAYFELARSFGGVILLDENTLVTDDAAKTRASLDDTYKFLINDLVFASENLPETNSGTRPTKWTAKAMLGKVYVYRKDWTNAKKELMEVVNSGVYDLLPEYNDVYQVVNERSEEIVFGIDCTDKVNADWGNSDYMLHGNILFGFCGPLIDKHKDYNDGWGFGLPSESLAKAFEDEGDTKRSHATLITVDELAEGIEAFDDQGNSIPPQDIAANLPTPSFGWEGYYCRKLLPLKEYQSASGEYYINYPQDYIIMRYAEVLYLAAEACMNSGAAGEGQPLFNKIRTRAGLPTLSLNIDNLLRDKRLELAMEGERFFDLVRLGKAGDVLGYKGFQTGKHEVFAIPQTEIDKIGDTLEQNPNY